MSKIIITRGPWGDWDCIIESYTLEGDAHCIKVGSSFDQTELLLKALAIIDVEVECHSYWHETVEENGVRRGRRVEHVTSNLKK